MAYESGSLDATLAAAAGEDIALLAELRGALVESAERQLDLLRRARCDGNWQVAAMRLKGLAATFHAEELLTASEEALAAVPGEPGALRRIEQAIQHLGGPGTRPNFA
ncbi:Hpt domain-containing protein [Altererythrobacter sp. BO-6]|uniref:Hpt domain-containing protein n=1 Tax=Altererythrobacter sp. BO-6 TaxID=2604537 RepID=UPI0013E17FA6|nr:Hpt domain-containing protein [Altererythrobacter sp. BO-6]QIG52869.1 Hpt domain-containing protein [Altererythrobacter sp. BO-6]